MIWKYAAVGCLALGLLPQNTALANAPVIAPSPIPMANIPESSTEEEQPPTEAPLPWAEILDGDLHPPLRVGEYNRITARMWRDFNDQRALRSTHITAACDALGSDMRYLRGRVPRQIEDAHRQMAPFQTKALSSPSLPPTLQPETHLSFGISPVTMTSGDPETLLEMIRSGEDPYTYYDLYQNLLWRFVALDLDDYLDPSQDDVPLSRAEFVGYVEILYQEWQDPTGRLVTHEIFLQEADLLIQELLTTLREVRRLLAILEATKANGHLLQSEVMKVVIPPSSLQLAQNTTLASAPVIERDDDALVTRRDFLLAMIGLISSLEVRLYRPSFCGDYSIETARDATQEMQQEVVNLRRELYTLSLEILALIDIHSR
jgi:hypothetical protein